MKKPFPTEFILQLFSLLIVFIIVHAVYVTEIRPTALQVLEEQKVRIASDATYVPERSVYILVRDYEQEACFVLMLWAMAILAFKGYVAYRQQRQLDWDLIGVAEGTAISAANARVIANKVREELPSSVQAHFLPTVLLSAIDRFSATQNVSDASAVVHSLCEAEADRCDSELSIIRYIAWAIPAIGFIGTVRGIGDALAKAHQAVSGDITGVTESLGVAFNSTLIALIISIVLMFIIHQIQLMQERLVLDVERYCDNMLIRRLEH